MIYDNKTLKTAHDGHSGIPAQVHMHAITYYQMRPWDPDSPYSPNAPEYKVTQPTHYYTKGDHSVSGGSRPMVAASMQEER